MMGNPSPTWFWVIAMVVFLVVEAIVPGLISLWFAIGALAAMIAAALGVSAWVQGITFLAVSILTLFLTRPLAKKYVNGKVQPTNADMIIGKECIVTEKIDNIAGTGAVNAGGKVWTARSSDDTQTIEKDSRALVDRIEGVKAIVHPINK